MVERGSNSQWGREQANGAAGKAAGLSGSGASRCEPRRLKPHSKKSSRSAHQSEMGLSDVRGPTGFEESGDDDRVRLHAGDRLQSPNCNPLAPPPSTHHSTASFTGSSP